MTAFPGPLESVKEMAKDRGLQFAFMEVGGSDFEFRVIESCAKANPRELGCTPGIVV